MLKSRSDIGVLINNSEVIEISIKMFIVLECTEQNRCQILENGQGYQ